METKTIPRVAPEIKPVKPDRTLTPDKLCPRQKDRVIKIIRRDV